MSDLDPHHGIIHYSAQVACNGCGYWMLGLKYPKARAVKELKENNWRLLKGKWYCPSCAEALNTTPL